MSQLTLGRLALLGVEVEEGGGEPHLPGGLMERFPLLRGEYRGQLSLVFQHEVSDLLQVSRSLLGSGLSPVLEGLMSRINRDLNILHSVVLDSLEGLVVVRVEDSEGVARQTVSPLPTDKSLTLSQHLPRTTTATETTLGLTTSAAQGCPGEGGGRGGPTSEI